VIVFAVFVGLVFGAQAKQVAGVTLSNEPAAVYISARVAADDLNLPLEYDARSDLAFLSTIPLDYHTAVGDQRFVALSSLKSLGATVLRKKGSIFVRLKDREIEIQIGKKSAVVDKTTQRLQIFQGSTLILTIHISTGKYSRSTPVGSWQIGRAKDAYHSSAKYDDAPMPWAVHVTRNIFLHGGVVPDYPASHGCIRLPNDVAEWFYNWTEPGTKLTIRR
jgi:lipoprotein-anchoring transpeptidase ErfK/SrfK